MERDRGVLQPRVHHCKGVVVQCTRHKELQSKCLHFKPDSSNCRTIILATLWPNQKWIIIKWCFSWIIMIANIFQSSPSWIKWLVSASSAVSGWWAKQWEKGEAHLIISLSSFLSLSSSSSRGRGWDRTFWGFSKFRFALSTLSSNWILLFKCRYNLGRTSL